MSKFIKLTNYMINTNYIHHIVIKPNKYNIHVMSNKFDGLQWRVWASGNGNIYSYNSEFEICKTKNANDYKIVSDWIANH
jgi:hypothetical protein